MCLKTPKKNLVVISATEIPRGPWPGKPIIVQHAVGTFFGFQLVTKRGYPVDIGSVEGIIRSFSKTKGEIRFLKCRLKKLGFELSLS